MQIARNILAPLSLALPLLVLQISQSHAGPAARGTLELTNPTDKSVTWNLVSYVNERSKGEYLKRGAHATAEPGKTAKGNKRIFLTDRLGAICYFTEEYPAKPKLDATNGLGGGLVCRTDHFSKTPNSIISITPRSNMSTCPVSQRAGKSPKKARRPRR